MSDLPEHSLNLTYDIVIYHRKFLFYEVPICIKHAIVENIRKRYGLTAQLCPCGQETNFRLLHSAGMSESESKEQERSEGLARVLCCSKQVAFTSNIYIG